MVRVSPGMLPPTISTTPNSPRVWTNVSTQADTTPGQASGSSTRQKVCHALRPLTWQASISGRGMDSNARCMGCTMNGTLNTTEASNKPQKLNASCTPSTCAAHCPSTDCPPTSTSR